MRTVATVVTIGILGFASLALGQCTSPPSDPTVLKCEKWSPPVPSGKGADFSPWYEIVSDPNPGYGLTSATLRLEGTHTCGRWAVCEQVTRSSDFVKWRFRIQGTKEVLPSEGILREKALLTTTWKKKVDKAP